MTPLPVQRLFAVALAAALAPGAPCQAPDAPSGPWEYRSGSFTDIHTFLPGGRMAGQPQATWEIRANQLVVRWPNGWKNIYAWVPGAAQLSGYNEDPRGGRQTITLTRKAGGPPPPPPASAQALGRWQYRSGSFTDVHDFLPGGRMGNDPRGSWELRGGQLIVRWPNGWTNTYAWVPGASELMGMNEAPNGQKQPITLTRQGEPAAALNLTGAWVHSADASTPTPDSKVIVVQDGNRVTLTAAYKSEGTQGRWVTMTCPGTLENGEVRLRCNWAPGGNPLGFAGDFTLTMRVSPDGNHMDGTLRSAAGRTQESHYSRLR